MHNGGSVPSPIFASVSDSAALPAGCGKPPIVLPGSAKNRAIIDSTCELHDNDRPNFALSLLFSGAILQIALAPSDFQ
jgi:hypothetical protein